MIVHNGKIWRTRSQKIYHNGREIAAVWRAGKRYYPDFVSLGIFVDENNYFYDVYQNKLRIRDGLTGELISHSESAKALEVYDGARLAAVRLDDTWLNWKILYEDGSSCVLTVPTEFKPATGILDGSSRTFGFRNGILAAIYSYNGGISSSPNAGYYAYTYMKDGTFLNTLYRRRGGMSYPYGSQAFPINAALVGIVESYVTPDMFYQRGRDRYLELGLTADDTTVFPFIWSDYYEPTTASNSSFGFLGRDDTHFYFWGQLHDPADGDTLLPDRVLARCSIDNFEGENIREYETERGGQITVVRRSRPEELDRYYESRSYTQMTQWGNLRRQRPGASGSIYEIYNPVTLSLPYTDLIGARTRAYSFYENSRYIWYDTIYSKEF